MLGLRVARRGRSRLLRGRVAVLCWCLRTAIARGGWSRGRGWSWRVVAVLGRSLGASIT